MEKKALGRGLAALIPETGIAKTDNIVYLRITEIKPSKYQPRESFDPQKQAELAASIKEKGVVQPILVRRSQDGYELIAGERRVRAVKSLAIEKIPAIIKECSDQDVLEIALIENIQREQLNPIEEAHAYKRLIDEFEFTQEKIAQVVGKDRSSVANSLRLLGLPEKIQELLASGKISTGHAKLILSLENANERNILCDNILRRLLSVREAENLLFKLKQKPTTKIKSAKDNNVIIIEEELQKILGTKINIDHKKKRGKIVIEYYSAQDLERILGLLRKAK